MMKAGLGAGNGGRTGSKGVYVGGGGDDAEERWGDVVWELIIKLGRTKEREMSSYCRDEVWKEQRSRDLTEEDTGGMEGRSRRRGSEREDKKMVNEVYEYTTCYWLTAFLVNCIFPMIASWLALLNENYPPILLFFSFLKANWSRLSLGGKKKKTKTTLFLLSVFQLSTSSAISAYVQ